MRLAGPCLLLAATLVTTARPAGAAPYDPQRRYQPAELQQDFRLLRGALEEAHPGLHLYISARELDRAFEDAQAALTRPMTAREFHSLVAPVVTLIRDGHTGVEMSADHDAWSDSQPVAFLPFSLWLEGDVLYVVRNGSNDPSIQPGDRLLEVNGVPVEKLIATARGLVSTDGFNETGQDFHLNFGALKRAAAENFDIQPPFTVTFQRADGRRFATTVVKSQTPPPGMGPPPARPVHSFEVLEGGVGLLTINGFSYDDELHLPMFKQLAERNVQHLILDLRGNSGGNGALAVELMRFLVDKPFRLVGDSWAKLRHPERPSFARHLDRRTTRQLLENNRFRSGEFGRYRFDNGALGVKQPRDRYVYRGALYVLTSGRTFSSASLFVASLKAQRKVIVIGQETGGAEAGFCAGINQKVTLPNTGLRLKLPLFRMMSASTAPDQGRGVMPDHKILRHWQDQLSGKDLELARALDLAAPKAVLSAPP